MPTGCFAELYFSPVVGLSLMVDLNLAYLLKGERLNTSTTQLVFVLVGGVFLWGSLVFFPHGSRSLFGPAFQLHVEEDFLLQGLLFIADFKNIFHTLFCGGFFSELIFLWDSRQFFQDFAYTCFSLIITKNIFDRIWGIFSPTFLLKCL